VDREGGRRLGREKDLKMRKMTGRRKRGKIGRERRRK